MALVPSGPGIPSLLSGYYQAYDALTLITSDAQIISRALAGPQWGIFDSSNTPLLYGNYFGDAIAEVSYSKDYRLSEYPIEQGSFATYDKVEEPYEAKVAICVGGPQFARTAALELLDSLLNSLTLVSVVTPNVTYPNANIIHYDYERSARSGAGMLKITIWLQEVRITATATASNTAQPSGADPVTNGNAQAATPTAAQSATIAAVGSH